MRCLAYVCCAIVFAGTFNSAALAESVTMKLAHLAPRGDPRDTASRFVVDHMNTSAVCQVDAKVYPSAQLGSSTDLIEGLQIGSIELVVLPASFLVGFEPLMGIFDFPYFWPSERDKLLALHQSIPVKKLLDATLDEDIVSLAVWHTGYKVWTSNTPLREPDDFKGLRARTMPSRIQVRAQELLGLVPVNLPFAETYSALQTGAIDTQENPITTNYVMRFHEVQNYATFDNHGTLDQIVMVARSWYEGLSEPCKSELQAAVEGGRKVVVDETVRMIEQALTAFTEEGMQIIELSEAQTAVLRAATLPGVKATYVEGTGDTGMRLLRAIEVEIAE